MTRVRALNTRFSGILKKIRTASKGYTWLTDFFELNRPVHFLRVIPFRNRTIGAHTAQNLPSAYSRKKIVPRNNAPAANVQRHAISASAIEGRRNTIRKPSAVGDEEIANRFHLVKKH
jgi:hypothetical protein